MLDIDRAGLEVGVAIGRLHDNGTSGVSIVKVEVAQGDRSTEIYSTARRDLEHTSRALIYDLSLVILVLNWQGNAGG